MKKQIRNVFACAGSCVRKPRWVIENRYQEAPKSGAMTIKSYSCDKCLHKHVVRGSHNVVRSIEEEF